MKKRKESLINNDGSSSKFHLLWSFLPLVLLVLLFVIPLLYFRWKYNRLIERVRRNRLEQEQEAEAEDGDEEEDGEEAEGDENVDDENAEGNENENEEGNAGDDDDEDELLSMPQKIGKKKAAKLAQRQAKKQWHQHLQQQREARKLQEELEEEEAAERQAANMESTLKSTLALRQKIKERKERELRDRVRREKKALWERQFERAVKAMLADDSLEQQLVAKAPRGELSWSHLVEVLRESPVVGNNTDCNGNQLIEEAYLNSFPILTILVKIIESSGSSNSPIRLSTTGDLILGPSSQVSLYPTFAIDAIKYNKKKK